MVGPRFLRCFRAAWLDNPLPIRDKENVFNRLGHLLLILALLGASGGHWAVLQSVAWATMLADNAQTDSFQTAFQKTFDGNHPCALCKQIAQGRQSEKKSDLPLNLKKLEFFNRSVVIVINSPSYFRLPDWECFDATLRAESPAVPPPRSFFV
jgi:hypothetical protein